MDLSGFQHLELWFWGCVFWACGWRCWLLHNVYVNPAVAEQAGSPYIPPCHLEVSPKASSSGNYKLQDIPQDLCMWGGVLGAMWDSLGSGPSPGNTAQWSNPSPGMLGCQDLCWEPSWGWANWEQYGFSENQEIYGGWLSQKTPYYLKKAEELFLVGSLRKVNRWKTTLGKARADTLLQHTRETLSMGRVWAPGPRQFKLGKIPQANNPSPGAFLGSQLLNFSKHFSIVGPDKVPSYCWNYVKMKAIFIRLLSFQAITD